MKDWQRGVPLETLRELGAPFRAHDDGLVLGAFTRVNDAQIATWLTSGRLAASEDCALASRLLHRPQTIRDFRREPTVVLPAGTTYVERIGYSSEVGRQTVRAYLATARRPACWLWQEHDGDQELARELGLRCVAVKVRSSSEILGLWTDPLLEPAAIPSAELAGLAQLDLGLVQVGPLRAALERLPVWAPHYSSYNEGQSWSALALRGYGDPTMIEKPAEMSKRWKADHPGWEEAVCADTDLRAVLPEVEPILARIPGDKQRVRLMRVAAGGRLGRHADIIDPEAGIAPGRVARIHVPLETNGGCYFSSWLLSGSETRAHMAVGTAWYLDTRKPHAFDNAGTADRIHLVVDTFATPELAALLR